MLLLAGRAGRGPAAAGVSRVKMADTGQGPAWQSQRISVHCNVSLGTGRNPQVFLCVKCVVSRCDGEVRWDHECRSKG